MTGRSVPAGTSSERLREDAVRDLGALLQTVAEVRKDLHAFEAILKKSHEHLVDGGRATDMSSRFNVGAVRAKFTDGLNLVERARITARLSLWRLQLSEGTNIADIARAWGLSRQLVSRALAARTRADAGTDPA